MDGEGEGSSARRERAGRAAGEANDSKGWQERAIDEERDEPVRAEGAREPRGQRREQWRDDREPKEANQGPDERQLVPSHTLPR